MLIKTAESRFSKLRVLFIQKEYHPWTMARHWSYFCHLGVEEGLRANGVKFFTLTSDWTQWTREICAKKKFDQVWINDLFHLDIDETLITFAPVRVGFAFESLTYSPEEFAVNTWLKTRLHGLENRLKYITHAITFDEKDADDISTHSHMPAIWLPHAVPKRYIFQTEKWNPYNPAAFHGSAYGDRQKWLSHPALKDILVHPPSPDRKLYHSIFNRLPRAVDILNKFKVPKKITLALHLNLLRQIRRRAFVQWLNHLQNYSAQVNLPSLFKGYVGHVHEGMAAGIPVISWRIPNRPKTEALFDNDKEILLFDKDNPDELARQIKRIKTEAGLAYRLIENAKKKMLRCNTIEIRVQQILNWIETGKIHNYV